MVRARLFALTAAVLAACVSVGTAAGRAQVTDPIPTLPTTTTSTTATTSTTQPPGSSTTTTLRPPVTQPPSPGPAPGPTPSPGPAPQPGPAPAPDGGGDAPVAGSPALTAEYQALMSSVARSGSNSTRRLLDALQPLLDLGVPPQEAIAQAFGRFPVGGVATFSHDWWFPRQAHLHQGTDIFAEMGTPVRAPADGVLRKAEGGLGGRSVYVTEPNGTYYYMAHLSDWVAGQVDGQQVKTGEVIGYVGNTGDAISTPPHLHFEIHMDPARNPFLYRPAPPPPPSAGRGRKAPAPKMVGPVIVGNINDPKLYGRGTLPANDPKPFLDQWIDDAVANVPALIAKLQAGRPQVLVATGMLRRFADGHGLFTAPSGPPKAQLLWASSANPSGGPLELAEAEIASVANELDWALLARREAARRKAAEDAARWAEAMLEPLTPPELAPLLGYADSGVSPGSS